MRSLTTIIILYCYYHNTMSYNIIILYGARVAMGDGAGRLVRPLRPAAKTVLKSVASGDNGFRVQRRAARATVPRNAGAAISAYAPRETAASRHLRRHCLSRRDREAFACGLRIMHYNNMCVCVRVFTEVTLCIPCVRVCVCVYARGTQQLISKTHTPCAPANAAAVSDQ